MIHSVMKGTVIVFSRFSENSDHVLWMVELEFVRSVFTCGFAKIEYGRVAGILRTISIFMWRAMN